MVKRGSHVVDRVGHQDCKVSRYRPALVEPLPPRLIIIGLSLHSPSGTIRVDRCARLTYLPDELRRAPQFGPPGPLGVPPVIRSLIRFIGHPDHCRFSAAWRRASSVDALARILVALLITSPSFTGETSVTCLGQVIATIGQASG
jgi:hypothetical protein